MDFRYRILPEKNLIAKRIAGPATLDSVLVAILDLWADPLYKPEFDVLCDLTGMTPHASARDVPKLCEFLRNDERASRGRRAVVIRHPMLTALTMLYQAALPPGQPFRIFSTMPAACDFLELDEPPVLSD